MKKLVTRREAEGITGLDRTLLQYYLLRDGIKPVTQKVINGKVYNFYSKVEVEALNKKLLARKAS